MDKFIKSAFSILIICNTFFAKAQTKPTTDVSFSGALMVSSDGKSVFYNMGGPSIKITYKKWHVAAYMLPSLRFFDLNGTINVNPILGTGLTFGYKRWMFGFPCYYIADKKIWVFTAGAGVRLGK